MNRWLILLEEFDYELKHISGKNNNEADILSRSYYISPKFDETDMLKRTTLAKITISTIKLQEMSQNNSDEQNKNLQLKEIHNLLIHPGKNKIFNTIKPYVSFKNMKKNNIRTMQEM
ncbi:Retrovirus-related Pol polyprotein from transposon 17.6 [Dictyocoela muelleri]|nr:Retrovirus-related Pol polyprotein from transposon 17.6 [Dictyocoela muelleri]